MTKNEYIRKLLETSILNFKFSQNYKNIEKGLNNSYYQMNEYFCTNEEQRIVCKILYQIIYSIFKKEEANIATYSTDDIIKALQLIDEEGKDGCYTYDFGVMWYGKDEFEKALDLIDANIKSKDKLINMLSNGYILKQLNEDISNIELISKDEYMYYLEEAYNTYAKCTFAISNNYILELYIRASRNKLLKL